MSVDNDKLQGVDYNFDLAKIYAISGEFELAIKELRKIQTAQPKAAMIGFLTHDAEFENIQEYSGFSELIDDYRKEQDI